MTAKIVDDTVKRAASLIKAVRTKTVRTNDYRGLVIVNRVLVLAGGLFETKALKRTRELKLHACHPSGGRYIVTQPST